MVSFQVRLIIVDSIAYLLRYDYSGAAKARDEIVWEICNKLKVLAIKHRICVSSSGCNDRKRRF